MISIPLSSSLSVPAFLMSVVILTGIHKGKLKRCEDPRLSCRTPTGTVCNLERCTVHRCWDPGRSGGFSPLGFVWVSGGASGFPRGRSVA